jgi:2-iminobutanoate/2-iminopropanoate deaminase
MKTSFVNASSAPQPSGGYSQAVEVSGAQRLSFISGQIPESAGGEVPEDFAAQANLVWQNLFAQLTAAGMTGSNLTKVTIFLSSRELSSANREIRQRFLGSHTAALTVIITGIFDEKWLLEIEAIAAA